MYKKFFSIIGLVLICSIGISAYAQEFTLKQQLANNIPIDEIQCKNNMHVLSERPNGKLACVYYETSEKLNWSVINIDTYRILSVYEVPVNGTIYDVEYTIKGGMVTDMMKDVKAGSLIITIDPTGEGNLTISLPRTLIDSKNDYYPPRLSPSPDGVFFVLMHGVEVIHDEILTTSEKRTLQISFMGNTTNIEIIGAYYV